MQYEQPPNPEQNIEDSFIDTIYQLAGNEPIDERGVQEVVCDLRPLTLTEAEKEATGNADYAYVQIINFLYEGETPEESELMEPEYLVVFYEDIDSTTVISHEYRYDDSGELRYKQQLDIYDENGKRVPGRDRELADMLGLPPEAREEGYMTKLFQLMDEQDAARMSPDEKPERFKAATNLLKRFIA